MLQVIQDPGRVFCSYSKLEKLKPGHLATIKSFMLLKRSKNSLNCFRVKFCQRQNTYEINTQETHQLMTPQSAKVTFAQSKPRILHSLLHPLFESASFKWSSTLFMLSSDGSGSLHCMTKGNVAWCAFVIEPVSCHRTRLVLALSE